MNNTPSPRIAIDTGCFALLLAAQLALLAGGVGATVAARTPQPVTELPRVVVAVNGAAELARLERRDAGLEWVRR
ncbi:MAG TPA: hypothetical protein VJM48_04330 [Methylibium sp.]|nr:hypothetical protein [Methylibium sp.]